MTNLEWIKALDEEDIVNFINSNCKCSMSVAYATTDYCFECKKGIIKWLKAEHKERTNDQ